MLRVARLDHRLALPPHTGSVSSSRSSLPGWSAAATTLIRDTDDVPQADPSGADAAKRSFMFADMDGSGSVDFGEMSKMMERMLDTKEGCSIAQLGNGDELPEGCTDWTQGFAEIHTLPFENLFARVVLHVAWRQALDHALDALRCSSFAAETRLVHGRHTSSAAGSSACSGASSGAARQQRESSRAECMAGGPHLAQRHC